MVVRLHPHGLLTVDLMIDFPEKYRSFVNDANKRTTRIIDSVATDAASLRSNKHMKHHIRAARMRAIAEDAARAISTQMSADTSSLPRRFALGAATNEDDLKRLSALLQSNGAQARERVSHMTGLPTISHTTHDGRDGGPA